MLRTSLPGSLIPILVIVTFATSGQSPDFSKLYKAGSTLYVFAPSGLSLRDKADLKAARIKVVPNRSAVIVQADAGEPVPVTNANIQGHWVKVKFNDQVGYLFDGYLSRWHPVQEEEQIGTYLARISPITRTEDTPPIGMTEYKRIEYNNGTYIEAWVDTDGGAYRSIGIPENAISFQETYLLASMLMPYYFKNDGCPYNANALTCEYEFATVRVEKKDNHYIIFEMLAD